MKQPRGFEEGGGDYVWKLKKTLYGTMQEAYDWAENWIRPLMDIATTNPMWILKYALG